MDDKKEKEMFGSLLSHVKEMATPIDFQALEDSGVLSKAGTWWRVHKMGDLPSHATKKITEMRQDSKGVKVKFCSHKRFERIVRKFAR